MAGSTFQQDLAEDRDSYIFEIHKSFYKYLSSRVQKLVEERIWKAGR